VGDELLNLADRLWRVAPRCWLGGRESWLLLAFIPAIAGVAFFSTRDRFEKEPKRLIFKLFVIGAVRYRWPR